MSKSKTVLGRGLEALISNVSSNQQTSDQRREPPVATDDGRSVGTICAIDLMRVRPNPFQPRLDFNKQALDELKMSILENGVIQPITVRRVGNQFELISGERRVRASVEAGLDTIPAYILDVDSDRGMLELALIENVQRENLNPIEVALGYQRLIKECSLRQEEVAHKVGKDRSTVTNFLRLLRLPQQIQESLRKNEISMGHARALLALTHEDQMATVWLKVRDEGLSVRRTEILVKDTANGSVKKGHEAKPHKNGSQAPPRNRALEETLEQIANRLQQVFGTHVRIKTNPGGDGSLVVDFYSAEDLERLLELFAIIEKNQ